MVFLLLFCCELFLLFLLSRFLTQSLSGIFFALSKSEKTTMWFLALLFFPGTVVHELSHFFAAILLFVPVGSIELFPKKHGDSIKLGSVAIGRTDPFRRLLIGIAPIAVGLTLLFFTIYYFIGFPLTPWFLNIALLLFIVFEIGNTMFSSSKDVEGVPALVIVVTLFIMVGYFAGIRIPDVVWRYLDSVQVQSFFQQLSFYMLAPLGINAMILLLARILHKR